MVVLRITRMMLFFQRNGVARNRSRCPKGSIRFVMSTAVGASWAVSRFRVLAVAVPLMYVFRPIEAPRTRSARPMTLAVRVVDPRRHRPDGHQATEQEVRQGAECVIHQVSCISIPSEKAPVRSTKDVCSSSFESLFFCNFIATRGAGFSRLHAEFATETLGVWPNQLRKTDLEPQSPSRLDTAVEPHA